jgi:hypothetical protein
MQDKILLHENKPNRFLSPLQGLEFFWRLTQSFALGYYLSGLQPFEFALIREIRVKVFLR